MSENYVEMICNLAEQNPEIVSLAEFRARPLHEAQADDLYQCYHASFSNSDATFFFEQSEKERREYFDSLGLAEAKDEPASLLLLKKDQIVGFTMVLPYGEGNRHISCMCVRPESRRQGLGEFMLRFAMQKARAQGLKTITLGTGTSMGAFQLYLKNGFQVILSRQ